MVLARKKTRRKWWRPKNNSMKSNGSSTSSTLSCTTNCPHYTTLGYCFWSRICNRISPPNNCSTRSPRKYVQIRFSGSSVYLVMLFNNILYQVFSEMESIVDKLATDYQHQSKMLNYFLGNKSPNKISNNIQSA